LGISYLRSVFFDRAFKFVKEVEMNSEKDDTDNLEWAAVVLLLPILFVTRNFVVFS